MEEYKNVLNNFKFKVNDEIDAYGCNFIYTASRKDENEEVFLVTWIESGKEESEIYHEKSVEEYLENGDWIIQ